MNYLFKTVHGEYEITEKELKKIFETMRNRGLQPWINLPGGVIVHNSNWDIVPIKEKGAPATEPWGNLSKKCCDRPAIQVRYRKDRNENKRYVPQCASCLHVGVQMKVADVIAAGYDPETVEPLLVKNERA